jgi:hypothetical protein
LGKINTMSASKVKEVRATPTCVGKMLQGLQWSHL